MMERCYSQADPAYKNYGGRGITVCERWHNFVNFFNDMGDPPNGRSLDRINNDSNYQPDNCRWTTPKEQAKNSRKPRQLTYAGETLNLTEWAERLGISRMAVATRLDKLGWPIELALSTSRSQKMRSPMRFR
jgi:hypothetical protein